MPTSVAADAARVNVHVFLQQADDGPAARVDLDVLVGPRAPRESPAVSRGGLLATATAQPPPVQDDVDAFLVREDLLQGLVQLPPLLRHDEEQPLHDRYSDARSVPGQMTSQTRPEGGAGRRRTRLYVEDRRRPRTKHGEVSWPGTSRWGGAGRPRAARARMPRRRPGRPHRRSDARRFAARSA